MNYRLLIIVCLIWSSISHATKLAIVLDDFGYRKTTEEQALTLPLPVAIAILPHSPLHKEMEAKARQQGREILIHMPMEPLSKQPLEKDTLKPTMSEAEIRRIIEQAIANVPSARGMNNHMGSAMTANLDAMKIVMNILAEHDFYFLDSVTNVNSQAIKAAEGTSVKTVRRHIFLDDVISETETTKQLNQAIAMARKYDFAVAIGHPHPSTIAVLKKMLHNLPADIELVSIHQLANNPLPHDATTKGTTTSSPQKKNRPTAESSRLPNPELTPIPRELQPPLNTILIPIDWKQTCPIAMPPNLELPSPLQLMIDWLVQQLSDKHPDNAQQEQPYLYIN